MLLSGSHSCLNKPAAIRGRFVFRESRDESYEVKTWFLRVTKTLKESTEGQFAPRLAPVIIEPFSTTNTGKPE
jgi:hypothetical protein